MEGMFNWLFKNKQDVESKEITEEVKVQCACDFNNNENCDLITKLRDLQKIEKDLKKEIKALERDSDELIFNFLGFLKSLEKDGYIMDNHYNYSMDYHDSYIVKRTISKYSSSDIFRITEELRIYKDKDDVIVEKKNFLREIQNDVKDIKDKLDIE